MTIQDIIIVAQCLCFYFAVMIYNFTDLRDQKAEEIFLKKYALAFTSNIQILHFAFELMGVEASKAAQAYMRFARAMQKVNRVRC